MQIALALCQRAVIAGHEFRLIKAADLMRQLATARAEPIERTRRPGSARTEAAGGAEIGYLPFGRDEVNLLFNIVQNRYERGSRLLTSSLRFTQWAGAFADDQALTAATLDWLLHHAHIVQTASESSRLKDKRKVGRATRTMTPAA